MPIDKTSAELREEQIARITRLFTERLRKSYPHTVPTLDDIERIVQEIGEKTKQDIQQEIVDSAGTGNVGKCFACLCGSTMQYKGDAARTIITLHGALVYSRAYYWCPSCRKGTHPTDTQLAATQGQFTASVRALACRFSSLLPFAKAAKELELVCGIHVSPSTMKRIAMQTGSALVRSWQLIDKRLVLDSEQDAISSPDRMQISMDGVMVHAGGRYREVKLGVCYVPSADGPKNDTYYATLGNCHDFGKRVKTLSLRAGESKCRSVAVVADGSDWIWKQAGLYYTQRVQILDFFHASQHLYSLANTVFGEGDKQVSEWVHALQKKLREDEIVQVLQEVRKLDCTTTVQKEEKRKVYTYLHGHQGRMQYKTYESKGYHIGSGVMESSCRWVVQQRMKAPGMRWSNTGAEHMLFLRTACCSDDYGMVKDAARKTRALTA
jgi:hypothetical protein